MIGVVIHGPQPFDSGLAEEVLSTLKKRHRPRTFLAGTMGRTALHDSGLKGVECPGLGPAQAVGTLAKDCRAVLLITHASSRESALRFGEMVSVRTRPGGALIQVEAMGRMLIQWRPGANAELLAELISLGFEEAPPASSGPSCWREGELICREIKGFQAGDFVLVGGIIVGRVVGERVVLKARGRELVQLEGIRVKEHGLEKLRRLGGIDLAHVKLATTSALRPAPLAPRVMAIAGRGVAFLDHASMRIFDLAREVEGVVSVGDDTTAVAGDILYRFGVPLVGIVDGDRDWIHVNERMSPGSSVLLVEADDLVGLEIKEKVFQNRLRSERSFPQIKEQVLASVGDRCLNRKDY